MATRFEREAEIEPILPQIGTPTIGLIDHLTRIGGNDNRAEIADRLLRDVEQARDTNSLRIVSTLEQFAKDPALQMDVAIDDLPPQLTGSLRQPDGSVVTGTLLSLRSALIEGTVIAPQETRTARVLSDGSFMLLMPGEWRQHKPTSIDIAVSGGNGVTSVTLPIDSFGRDGNAGPITLPRNVSPAPLSVFAGLENFGDLADPGIESTDHLQHAIAIGEGECSRIFRSDASQDRFAYGVLFRLTDPHMSAPTLAGVTSNRQEERESRALRAIYPDELNAVLAEQTDFHAVERVAIDRPIAVSEFRRNLSGADTPRRLPIAASLAIGYVVNLAQRWSPNGLALGDLVYSLPLAPGEQQRIAMVERVQTSSVMEREALEQREDLRFDESDSSSVQATFAAAFNESAQGGSNYDASSSSFSVAAAAGGGGVFPFGAFAGGVATSYGSASSSGSSNTWMSGARQSTSNAAQSTHAAVSRRASANRSSARTGVRLASASETTSATTKIITNHNKTRALTMQYWEVLRLFDVQTVVEDVSLVCLVPLDVVDFLPAFEQLQLDANGLNRNGLLNRYGRMLEHADVLTRTVPWRLRRGLQALIDFAADPRATVQSPTGIALNIVNIQVFGGFTVQDTVYAHLLLRNGIRTGSVPLSGSPNPLPPTGASADANETELFNRLRNERHSTSEWLGEIALSNSIGLQDVVAVVLTHAVQRLDYTFAPDGVKLAQSLLSGHPNELAGALSGIVGRGTVTRSYDPVRVKRELGDLRVTQVSARVGVTDVATQSWPGGNTVPEAGLTVPANRLPPELSYDSVLDIERTLQWVLRNTMSCSTRIAAALTAEERIVMLERYSITPPSVNANNVVNEGVPLLSCVTNNVLGFYGNAMVFPFQIPLSLADEKKLDSGKLQRALKRFHTEAFDHPKSVVALPTKGVLGEAVLGRCPSAEKIDLTRFWNWQDSPGDAAPEIGAVTLPSDNLLKDLEAPSKLTGLTPIINNFSTQGPTADSSLATAIAGKALELAKPFDIDKLTNAGNLATVVTKTADTAESARKDALSAAKELAIKAMETAAGIDAKKKDGDTPKEPAKQTPETEPGTTPTPQPPSGTVTPPAPVRPATLKVFFNLNETDLVDVTNEGRAGQNQKIAAFITAAKAFKPTAIVVRGFASPEGTAQRNAVLVKERADVMAAKLRAELAGVTITTAVGGVIQGPPSSEFPELRRADAEITAP